MGLENLAIVSPVGISGNYILMGVSQKKPSSGEPASLLSDENTLFVRIAESHVSFELIKHNFLFDFYSAFDVDLGAFLEKTRECKDAASIKEIMDLCQKEMSRVPYEAHLLSWGDIIWSRDANSGKPKINVHRYEPEAENVNPFLKLLDIPLRFAEPDADIIYQIRRFQHQVYDQKES